MVEPSESDCRRPRRRLSPDLQCVLAATVRRTAARKMTISGQHALLRLTGSVISIRFSSSPRRSCRADAQSIFVGPLFGQSGRLSLVQSRLRSAACPQAASAFVDVVGIESNRLFKAVSGGFVPLLRSLISRLHKRPVVTRDARDFSMPRRTPAATMPTGPHTGEVSLQGS